MTLRKSMLLSLVLHLFLVGTGITFSRYAGNLLRRSHEPIMVALIGSKGTAPAGGDAKKAELRPFRKPAREQKKETVRDKVQEVPVEKPSSAKEAVPKQQESVKAAEQNVVQGSHKTAALGPESAGTGNQQAAAGTQSGMVSSEQWAVIVSSIERAKSYPRLARERGIQGVVRLRFKVKPRGDVERVEIVKSSGSEILDTASVKTLYQAGRLPYVSGWVEVPIAYVLK